ncbi:hypothetical protein BCR35DRAFT_297473 [Leucosporidium creatinivorum]|uniref:Uncharacterized protein n=1 Tax=Leucosporidium creatinivorum TaxID=106004 RepID=A0A1Y2CA94_9BASI|nr:hypothetical protein BCR35DRAFT_297473 [Leucosporidium creatinivorum]
MSSPETVPPTSESDAHTRQLQRHVARQQIATPLSLLIFIVAATLAQTVAKPSLKEISNTYLTVLTPNSATVGAYWVALGVLLVGHCVMLAVPGKSIALLVNGVGLRLAAVNILMAVWTLCFVFGPKGQAWFIAAEIILLLVFVLALSMWATLFYYPSTHRRPIEFAFAHVPIRMLLIILLEVDIWQGGLLALGYYRHPTGDKPHWEAKHSMHSWIIFGIVLGVALLQAVQVFYQRDVVWAACSILLYVALCLNSEGKSPPVFIALVLSACLIFVSLVSSIGWALIKSDREGAIRLVDGEDEDHVVAEEEV